MNKKKDRSPLCIDTVKEMISPQLVNLLYQINSITRTWNPVEIVTPDAESFEREKKRFLKAFMQNKSYDPSFDYVYAHTLNLEHDRVKLIKLGLLLDSFEPSNAIDKFTYAIARKKIVEEIATCDLVEGIKKCNEKQIAASMRVKYALLDDSLWTYAQNVYQEKTLRKLKKIPGQSLIDISDYTLLKNKWFDANDLKIAFEWVLSKYNILKNSSTDHGYTVVISDEVTDIDVRDKSMLGPAIFIPKDKRVKGKTLLALVGHEIEGHARQSINGAHLWGMECSSIKTDDETAYEGLAKRNDEDLDWKLYGHRTGAPLPYFIYGIKRAEEGWSFSQIFKEQLDLRLHMKCRIPWNQEVDYKRVDQGVMENALRGQYGAYRNTYRVMRGHTDTSNKEAYAFPKDAGYLRGWLLDKQLIKIGFGHFNEMAIIDYRLLPQLVKFDVRPCHIPLPYKDYATAYWKTVLKPQLGH